MASKRPTLAEIGVDKLFRPSMAEVPTDPLPKAGESEKTPAATVPPSSWEATHRRRTFHCPNATWDRLEAWCRHSGMSRSAAISAALADFLEHHDHEH